jgi:hypothetical protein
MICFQARQLLKNVGITIINAGPFKEYWELVYEAPFRIPIKHRKLEPYSDEEKMFVTRKIYKEEPGSKLLWELSSAIDLYIEALREAQEVIDSEAAAIEKNNVRRDDVEDS